MADLISPPPPLSLFLEITSTNIYEILLDEVNDRYNKQIQFFPPPNSISTGIWKISLLSIVFINIIFHLKLMVKIRYIEISLSSLILILIRNLI